MIIIEPQVAVQKRRWGVAEFLVAAAPSVVGRADPALEGPLFSTAAAALAPAKFLQALLQAHPKSQMKLPALL